MKTITATKAGAILYKLLDEASQSHEPMHESIREGLKTPPDECDEELE